MKRINNTLNKKFILDTIKQDEIFARYLGIDVNTIKHCATYGTLINSPIRVDGDPSVGFKYNAKGILKMRDFGGFFWGDCFDVVAYVLSKPGKRYNINDKNVFKFVLYHIAAEFNKIDGVSHSDNIKLLVDTAKKRKKIIDFNIREWDANDKRFWINKYHKLFTLDYLSSKHVYPVENYWIDIDSQPEPKYYYTRNDPCYAYYLGKDADGISNIKLYFPNRSNNDRRRPKFISNNNSFQGILDMQNKYDYIVLMKSYKDVLAGNRLVANFSFTGIDAVLMLAYPSENYILNDEVFHWLLSRLTTPDTSRIINFVDFDRAGRANAKRLSDTYNIAYTFFTNGEFGLPNYGAKDLTDFIEAHGLNTTYNVINEFINEYRKYNDCSIAGETGCDEEIAPF